MDYEGSATVRAFLRDAELDQEAINQAARKLGWPKVDPHPMLVAEKVER